MKQLSRSKAATKLFSPATLALAVGFACWGSVVLAEPGIANQGAAGGLSSYRTAPPPKIGDDKPTNKYANDFAALKDQIAALDAKVSGTIALQTDLIATKAQVTALQTAVAGLPNVASITALQTSLAGVTAKIDAITTTLNTVATAGTATKAVVDGLKTNLTALKTNVTALATKVAADNLAMKTQSTPLKK
jgi:phage shock protein A